MKTAKIKTGILIALLLFFQGMMLLQAEEPAVNNVYQCGNCFSFVYASDVPAATVCAAAEQKQHWWIRIADLGESVYQCTQCAVTVQARYLFQNAPCSKNKQNGHVWNKLGTLGDKQYLCKYCQAYVYLKSKPSNKKCANGERHEWCSLGKIGNRHYRCHYCRFEVYAAAEPSRQNCPMNVQHYWVQLNFVDTQTVIRCFPGYCGLSYSPEKAVFYFRPGKTFHLSGPIRPGEQSIKPPAHKPAIRIVRPKDPEYPAVKPGVRPHDRPGHNSHKQPIRLIRPEELKKTTEKTVERPVSQPESKRNAVK